VRIVRFCVAGKTSYGVLVENEVRRLRRDPFIQFGLFHKISYFDSVSYRLDNVRLLAPCAPSKIVCLGLNYRSHIEEMGLTIPSVPLIFLKPSTAVVGPNESIILPPGCRRVDYEGELAVIVGKKAKGVPVEEAAEYVLGYTCFNDVSDREAQAIDGQWTRAKGYDTFAPIGPWIETDISPDDLKLETYVNGDLRQSASTKELVFSVPELISFISQIMTLLPGDVIATGTPEGVGPLRPGDIVQVKVEGIGVLTNPVVSSQSPA